MDIRPEFKQKSIRSYVIRSGRMTEAQENGFKQYWPTYGLSLFAGVLDTVAAFERSAPVVLEIGFGMGDSFWQMAQADPDKNFLGIEVHPPGVGCLINNAAKAELTNLKVYMADAIDVLDDCIEDGSLNRFQLFFPDPWHKTKHKKRRMVQPEFVNKLIPKLKPGAVIHMATDWEEYAKHMMKVLSATPELENNAGDQQFSPRPDYRPITKFEMRGERLGHGTWDLLFTKQPI